MKLHQTEYCHNCNQYVDFEFEDTTERQIIYCPKCGHEHYRELDGGTIINMRIHPNCREVRVAKLPRIDFTRDMGDVVESIPIQIETVQITEEERRRGFVERKGTPTVSDRRWGRDPRQ